MFDIGASELLVIVIVAVLVIGPKDMPMALRAAGRWIGKIRRVSSHFRTGIDAMVREAELEEMEKKWKAQNEEIMARSRAEGEMAGPPLDPADLGAPYAEAESRLTHDPNSDDPAPDAIDAGEVDKAKSKSGPDQEPELPLGKGT
ncbi:Twin-arginine translocation protein TatB [Altererythrobacter epoxidivorans]|uniref:Sec-independent protein translocase protein TatB n=1 Tax=Altererythrobacter epoxidivorans TaxID=361183 RepID=A0A0M4LW54_9SPHN|nr:Sec-independent protein translocase protein TatB [Altererythrobacter epoxidivorans]ALE17197.1 Twin-arginine translocation protein TatB [Altererythrobacter epoxidivorans]